VTRDAFGTAALRAAVLEAWRASPARLREDANTEEDHARGYYRDRVLVELAQNAADAAVRAGVPGRLLLRLASTPAGSVLVAANTGAPLDAAGVASLASMRASAKREHAPAGDPSSAGVVLPTLVGRFGVGFAAVRAVADEVSVLSTTGGVRFSLADTVELLAVASAGSPALADEVRRRDGSLPALRLPLPADGAPPSGYDTAVVLELRDEVAADEVRALLAGVGDPLLLALPGLVEILVEDDGADRPVRRVADVHERWRVAAAQGELDLVLLADRPVEERSARTWRVTWALPRPGAAVTWDRVVHAPTPTDEPCTVPALLVATLPLDPARRHVAPGALTDAVLGHAAGVLATLATDLARAGDDPLVLVPTGLASGPLDGALRAHVVDRLARTPLLHPADGDGDGARTGTGDRAAAETDDDAELVREGGRDTARANDHVLVEPGRAVAVAGEVGRDARAVRALAAHARGLVVLPLGAEPAARTLGVEIRDLAELVEELPAAGSTPPGRWRALYAALDEAAGDPAVREALGALPVPLADGRTVRGARGLVLLDPGAAFASAQVGAFPDGTAADRTAADGTGGHGSPADGATTGTDGPDGPGGPLRADVVDALRVLARWGLRVVHPDAVHPLLERLGAGTPDAVGLLGHPAVRQAVLDAADDDDLELARDVTEAVLALVAAVVAERGGSSVPAPEAPSVPTLLPADVAPWLGLLTLPASDGEPTPAHGLVLPGSIAARLLDDRVLAAVQVEVTERWGADVLVAAGVRADLALVRVGDVVAGSADLDGTDPGALAAGSLDAWDEYADELARTFGSGAYVPEVVAVADLDAVAPDAWPEVLERLAQRPDLRRALLDPVRAEGGGDRVAPSYTAWWLRRRGDLGLERPFALHGAPDDAVRGLLPPAPAVVAGLDPEVQRALGGLGALDGLDPGAWRHVLGGLGPAGSPVDVTLASGLWRTWADLAGTDVPGPGDEVELVPAFVSVTRVAVVHADDVAVADAPMWWQRTDVAALVPVPGAPVVPAAGLAVLLGVPLASDLAAGQVDAGDGGDLAPTPEAVLRLLPDAPRSWVEHEELRVDGVPVDWWVEGQGRDAVVHATQLAALARGLAQAAGRWAARHAVEIVLTEPGRADEITLEAAADPVG
jgi:hypothetical protein